MFGILSALSVIRGVNPMRGDPAGHRRCPLCAGYLEAPRLYPVTGRLARKCPACREWYTLEHLGLPNRSE